MDTKGANLAFTLLLLIFSNEALAQGEISINQDFRKPADDGASVAPIYEPYYSETSASDSKGDQLKAAPPFVEPPVPVDVPPAIDVEYPSEAAKISSEPVVPPVPVQPEGRIHFTPSNNNDHAEVYEEEPSVVVGPVKLQPILGPPPVPQQSRYSEVPLAEAKPVPKPTAPTEVRIPTLAALRGFSWRLSREQIEYKFGRNHPTFGGLDSSGAIQFILKETGLTGVPRTTKGLNSWVRDQGALYEYRIRPTEALLTSTLEPGNLIFWGDLETRKLTHVMVYMGFDVQRGHLAFGTRGGGETGINNSEIDIFPLYLDRERIISTGRIPGLIKK